MRPLCEVCGEPIGVFERLWLEPPGGGLVSSSLMKLRDEERREARRMYHEGCISEVSVPDGDSASPRAPSPELRSPPSGE